MTAYRLALRRSPVRWWLPLFVLVELIMMFWWGDRSWIGVWPQASAAVQFPTFYLGPLVSAAAAWSAGAPARRGGTSLQDASPRPAWQREAPDLLATLTYPLAAYLGGALLATVVTWPLAGPGFLWPGYVLLGATVITLCGATGHIAGRLTQSPVVTSSAVALGSVAFLGTLGEQHYLGLSVISGDPQVTVTVTAAVARLAVGGAVAALALLVVPHLRGVRRWPTRPAGRMGFLCGAAALPVALALTIASGPVVTDRPAPVDPLCTTTSPRLCLWPEHRKYLPPLTALAKNLASLPPGLLVVPDTLNEQKLDPKQDPGSGFLITGDDQWSVATTITTPILKASLPAWCPRSSGKAQQSVVQAQQELRSWLATRAYGRGKPSSWQGGPPGIDEAAIAALLPQPEETQAAWVRARLQVINETPCA